MNGVLDVRGLCKSYPAFKLEDVSFSLEAGKITGFIGRNGAGKTTTLKSILGFVHPERGDVRFFGAEFAENEQQLKQDIGYISGGFNFYPMKKLKTITAVTKRCYKNWDGEAYRRYTAKFALDENKTPAQLSDGMKVKYALALALSHRAKLLILDEPTSGLDPVSRDELLDLFIELQNEGVTILFSTHITSDLDKCADNIIYIRNGHILAESALKAFTSDYLAVTLNEEQRERSHMYLIGCKPAKSGYTAIINAENAGKVEGALSAAELETVMIHLEKEEA